MSDLVFGDKSIEGIAVVEEIRRPFAQTITNVITAIPGRSGQYFRASRRGEKIIEVDLRMIRNSRLEVTRTADQLRGILVSERPKKLVLRDDPDKYVLAILDGLIAMTRLLSTGFATLTFLVPDGVSYALEETSGTTNEGNEEAPWILRAKRTSGVVTITNSHTQQQVRLDEAIEEGAAIVVDFGKHYVSVNGQSAMKRLYFESDFWLLKPGENPYTYTGLSEVDVTHRARWL